MLRKLLISLLFITSYYVEASSIDSTKVYSYSMEKQIGNYIILPNSYDADRKEAYSVLYLLHGATGNYKNWATNAPKILEFADKYDMIIVTPDGGFTSWYWDSPIDNKMKYETYVASELIKFVDKNFNTKSNKEGRAITGLSMGGHGAMYLAIKHQDIFGAVGSMSGGVDITPFPNEWDMKLRLGEYADNQKLWQDNTVINMLHLIKPNSLEIMIDCGTDDFFHNVNKNLHNKMNYLNIHHDYIERPGKHNWNYWRKAIKYQIVFFNDFFGKQQ